MIDIPAKAGTQPTFWASAFAGATKAVCAILLLLFAFTAPAAAQTFPKLTGRVVDQANLLSPQQEAELTSRSEALEVQTGRQFVVATVNSLEGQEIEFYATELFRHWKLGDKDRDDGILLLVAPNEKKVRIETGYGAEGFLPDILAGRIIRNDILPRFREGDMAGGIMAGADAIIRQVSLTPEQAQEKVNEAAAAEQKRDEGGPGFLPIIFWGMIIGFVLLSFARRASGRRYLGGVPAHKRRKGSRRGFDAGDAAIILWGLSELADSTRKGRSSGWGGGSWGGGGGGFGGFSGGGGMSGGGGASGSW